MVCVAVNRALALKNFEAFLPGWANAGWTGKSEHDSTMKPKLQLGATAAIFLLSMSLGAAPPQSDPNTAPAIDPNTVLPLRQPKPWKDPDWKDPDLVLTNVFYDGLPLGEVAHDLRGLFKHYFDVLTPVNQGGDREGWQDITIRLQLRNVTASEVFNAMNLVFENDKTPLRWELTLNGHRPTALLRALTPLAPPAPIDRMTGLPVATRAPEPKRMVFFVGELTGDEKSGGMTMEQVVKTVQEVWDMTYSQPGAVQFHRQAQLLIVTGTPDQIEFIQWTLAALREKEQLRRKVHPEAAESKPKTADPKSSGGGGSR